MSYVKNAPLAERMLIENSYQNISFYEYTVLCCAIVREAKTNGGSFDYSSVVEATKSIYGKSMNVVMIYKAIASLEQRLLINCIGQERSTRGGRSAKHYVVTRRGQKVFEAATTCSIQLQKEP